MGLTGLTWIPQPARAALNGDAALGPALEVPTKSTPLLSISQRGGGPLCQKSHRRPIDQQRKADIEKGGRYWACDYAELRRHVQPNKASGLGTVRLIPEGVGSAGGEAPPF